MPKPEMLTAKSSGKWGMPYMHKAIRKVSRLDVIYNGTLTKSKTNKSGAYRSLYESSI